MMWFRLLVNFYNHPKIRKLSPAARDLWVCGIAYCNEHMTDGLLSKEAVASFPATTKRQRAVNELTSSGLWRDNGGTIEVRDFLQWNDNRETIKAKVEAKNSRQRKWRDASHVERRDAPETRTDTDTDTDAESSLRSDGDTHTKARACASVPARETSPVVSPTATLDAASANAGAGMPQERHGVVPLLPSHGSASERAVNANVVPIEDATCCSATTRAILEELRLHPSLLFVATVRHAERQAAHVDGGGKKLEWVLSAIRELADKAGSREDSGAAWDIGMLSEKLATFCRNAREPRANPIAFDSVQQGYIEQPVMIPIAGTAERHESTSANTPASPPVVEVNETLKRIRDLAAQRMSGEDVRVPRVG